MKSKTGKRNGKGRTKIGATKSRGDLKKREGRQEIRKGNKEKEKSRKGRRHRKRKKARSTRDKRIMKR